MKLLQGMVIAFSMYSRLPMPKIDWNKSNMRFSMCFFPLVGVIIGALMCGWFYLSRFLGFGAVFTGVIFVLLPILVTGGIHMDGFLDTVDAVSSYQTMERRLEILKDSSSGAFAVIYGIAYMLALLAVWCEVKDQRAVFVLAAGFALSRSLSGYGITAFKCAKDSGLAASFSGMADKKISRCVLIAEAALSAAVMIIADWRLGCAAAAAALAALIIYRRMSYRMFGGITGDLAGFFLQTAELMMGMAVVVLSKLCM